MLCQECIEHLRHTVVFTDYEADDSEKAFESLAYPTLLARRSPRLPRISDVPASRVEFDILLVCTQSPQSDTDSNSSYSTESKQQPVAGMDNPTYRSYPPPLHEYSIKQKQNPGQIVPKPVRICSTHRLHRGRGCGRRRLCRGAGNSFTAHGDFRE